MLDPKGIYNLNLYSSVAKAKSRDYKSKLAIEPSENGSIFTATLDFHIGKLLSKLARKTVQQISQHMIEEGQNLKKILVILRVLNNINKFIC